jgi:hypothetical protein
MGALRSRREVDSTVRERRWMHAASDAPAPDRRALGEPLPGRPTVLRSGRVEALHPPANWPNPSVLFVATNTFPAAMMAYEIRHSSIPAEAAQLGVPIQSAVQVFGVPEQFVVPPASKAKRAVPWPVPETSSEKPSTTIPRPTASCTLPPPKGVDPVHNDSQTFAVPEQPVTPSAS